jgi:hypothetical protein
MHTSQWDRCRAELGNRKEKRSKSGGSPGLDEDRLGNPRYPIIPEREEQSESHCRVLASETPKAIGCESHAGEIL